ncbi:Dps family protein [Dyella silvae]|uniref:Dps family protein n=1 Tax=Dyella silvae TaxID=2994424 RepID=UPI0022651E94|nr:DNA starvation/stationary phase protection protein [Dyella silvae]
MSDRPPFEPGRTSSYVHPEFSALATHELTEALNGLLADYFALFVKTKGFCWHVTGPNFLEHRTLLAAHAAGLFKVIDPLGERVRKLGGTSLFSVEDIVRRQRISKSQVTDISAQRMFAVLRDDNQQLLCCLREAHGLCDGYGDVATMSLLGVWIDEAEARLWHLHDSSGAIDSAMPSLSGGISRMPDRDSEGGS